MPIDTSPVPDYKAKQSLEGRVIVVVGAGQGMGRQSAHAAAAIGATVVCIDREEELASAVAEEVGGSWFTADVTDRASVHELFGKIAEKYGTIQGVIDVVGGATWHAVIDTTEDIWERDFKLNVLQARYVIQEAFPLMRENGGNFSFVSSVSAMNGAEEHSAYGAAKAALISIVKSSAVELARFGIRVNSVAPGVIMTPRMSHSPLYASSDFAERQAAHVPLGRLGATDDIASALVFLVTDSSSYISGQTLVVDGGTNAKFAHLTSDEVRHSHRV